MKHFIVLIALLFISVEAFPQFDILKKVKDKVEDKTKQKVDQAIDSTIDNGTKDTGNKQNTEGKETTGQNKENTNTGSTSTGGGDLKSYSKYDFVPGDQVLFFEDFSSDNPGDFPALWNTNSSGEVVTLNNYPGHWFQPGLEGTFLPEIKGSFGENFTLEFDLIYAPTTTSNLPSFDLSFYSSNKDEQIDAYVPGNGGCAFKIGAYALAVSDWKDQEYGPINNSKDNQFFSENINKKVRLSFSFQKQRVRFWINEDKIFDLPKLLMSDLIINQIRFTTEATDDQKPYFYISNIRFAVGQPDMRSKLLTEGKLVTRGILFDVNSDQIKPESYGTLKEIAKVLQDNKDIRVKIIGHTDSDGSDASNLDLSKRRAASVKSALSTEFGIDAVRMETDGKGESEPVADNNTAEGKANNRRVEFIKL
jgi:outer membrane protein OmpA-like peptidoglycan-associated protein